jgi:peptidyl-prolyl cis-trans isomerase D
MLSKIRESTGRGVAIAILALIAITFIFVGVDFSLGGTTFAAKVNGENIPLLEFERELQQTQNQYQQIYPVELTEDLRRELRRSVVDRMVLTKALQQRAESAGYRISDARLSEALRSTPAFQVGGQFSIDAYRARLNSQGLTPSGYEAMLRQQLELLELQNGIGASTFLTPAEYRRYIEIFNERRELGFALFSAEDFLAGVEVTDAEVAEHYAANPALYMSEETVDIEYIELDQATLAAGIEVNDEVLEDYYNEQQDRFATTEERRTRHILVNVEGDDYAAAEAEAAAILERIEAGEDFAALAAELSDDPGTRAQGGDLGWIGRGLLAGPFEDALYGLEVGGVAGPVETEFGYHIIRLDAIREGDVQSFAAVRDELAAEYGAERAVDLFYDEANRLADLAFRAYDELASVAMQMDVPLKTLTGYSRRGAPGAFANNAPVVQAAFDDALITTGNNSPLIELSNERVVVLRVTAHNLPAQLPLEEVSDAIRAEIARGRAEQLAAAAAAAFLADLEAGEAPAGDAAAGDAPVGEAPVGEAPVGEAPVGAASSRDPAALAESHGGTWNSTRWVQRTDPSVPTELLATAFSVLEPLPADGVRQLVPLASGDGAVLLLSGVERGNPESMSIAERDQRQRQLAEDAALSEMTGYAADVRDRARVRIPDAVLNPQF